MMNVTVVPVHIAAGVPPIDAVRLPDRRMGATLRSLCRVLNIDSRSQLARIRRHPRLSEALIGIPIQFGSSKIQMDVVLHWAFPVWATGLSISRLPAAKRPAALLLQSDAVALIERAFTESSDKTPTPEALPHGPVPKKVPKSQSLSAVLAQAGDIIDSRFEAIESAQALLSSLLTELVASLPADMVAPSGTIAPMRLPHIYALAGRVRQSYGVPIVETLILLAEHFHVEDVSDLPAAAWPAVLDWFKGYLLTGYPPGV